MIIRATKLFALVLFMALFLCSCRHEVLPESSTTSISGAEPTESQRVETEAESSTASVSGAEPTESQPVETEAESSTASVGGVELTESQRVEAGYEARMQMLDRLDVNLAALLEEKGYEGYVIFVLADITKKVRGNCMKVKSDFGADYLEDYNHETDDFLDIYLNPAISTQKGIMVYQKKEPEILLYSVDFTDVSNVVVEPIL